MSVHIDEAELASLRDQMAAVAADLAELGSAAAAADGLFPQSRGWSAGAAQAVVRRLGEQADALHDVGVGLAYYLDRVIVEFTRADAELAVEAIQAAGG
ncbi:MAG: hypothetical protein LBK42_13390 [Propionibacteriaceae bacterium]|jgi:hypothetical protein|nr:hypothetical protein [Propionibacteriaceae bacterium]